MSLVTSRRAFIGTAATLALAPGIKTSHARANTGMKLGVASYSLREFPRTEAIEILKELQVSYVSIKSFHLPYESSHEELVSGSQEFRDAGLTILSGGNIDLKKPEQNRRMFEYAKSSGMPMMVCAPSHATLDQVEELVQEFDIKTAIHNHGPEDDHFPSPESILKAIESRDRRMGLCVDIGHTTRTGADVVEWIRRAGPRLFDVHVKDLRDLMHSRSQCDVGEGAMPIVSIFQQLRHMNYQGGVMLEYEINADAPLKGMLKSLAYMRGVMDGLSG